MTITAKYAGTCSKCRRPFAAGSKIDWAKGSGSAHADCGIIGAAGPARAQTRAAKRTGCSCGSLQGIMRSGDCWSCKHDF